MNKQQRDYTVDRIRNIAQGKEFECECEKPSLKAHIRRAIAAGTSKMKSAKDITAMFEKRIIESEGGYRESLSADLPQLFEEPQSYKDAMAELAAEQRKHAEANAEVQRYAQYLIDAVELGKYEDGAEPIRLMEAFQPKPPASAKKR